MVLLIPITLLYGFFAVFGLYKIFSPVHQQLKAPLPQGVSVVIAMKDEMENIIPCLTSILKNHPPFAFEVIVVDDVSTDKSFELVEELKLTFDNVKLIEGSGDGKKSAINIGVQNAQYPIILQTDADCVVSEKWIEVSVHALLNGNHQMVIGPVYPVKSNSLLNKFVRLEWLGLQFITMLTAILKKPGLANGANLTYYKNDFLAFSRTKTGNKYASGDDMFLLLFLRKQRKSIKYNLMQDAIVITRMPERINEFIQQRIRWASKSNKTTNPLTFLFLLIVALANFAWIGALVGLFQDIHLLYIFIICVGWKMTVDFLICWNMSRFFNDNKVLVYIPIMMAIYPVYLVFGMLLSFKKRYRWKGKVTQ